MLVYLLKKRELEMKKTILVLANNDLGLYKFRKELLELFLVDNEVFFCTPDGKYTGKMQGMGCKFIPCNMLDRRSINPFKDLSLIHFYVKTIKKVHPDIVLTYTIKPNVYGGIVCACNEVPYIANITGLGTTIENGGLLAFIAKFLYRIGLKKAKCVFFQNEDNLNFFVKNKIVSGRTRLIPGSGVNLNTHCYEPYPPENQGIKLLFVGRIMKDKGIEELLKVIRKLHRNRKNLVLDVVGFCDEDYSHLLNEAEKEGAIVNHGIQSDMHPFYTATHCTVLPSYHEGMANVMLESSSTGRPVITTRVPGCKETFNEGITGFGCEARSVESLENAILEFLGLSHEEKEEMGRQGRKKMESEFDRNIILKAYQEEIIAASEGPPRKK